MPFLSLSNTNVEYVKLGNLTQRTYTTIKALPITSWIEIVDKEEFARTVIDETSKTFVIYMLALEAPELLIHLFRVA